MIVLSLIAFAGMIGGCWFLAREFKGIVRGFIDVRRGVKTHGPDSNPDADAHLDGGPLDRRTHSLPRH